MEKNAKIKGITFTVLSALLFGFTPILASRTYSMGSNAMTLTFYRNLLVIPVLFLLMLIKRIDFRVTARELGCLVAIGILGRGCTTFMLYASYDYVGTGTATTLHFMYPVFVTLISVLAFRERPGKTRVFALLMAVAGMLLFFEKSGGLRWQGVALAVVSGLTYACYMLGMEKTMLRDMHPFKVSFYMAIAVSCGMLLANVPMKKIVFALDPLPFLLTLIIAMCTSLFAVIFLQIGVVSLSASTAAILSLFEPVTCFICGAVFLQESVGPKKIIGSVLILLSAAMISAAISKKETPTASAAPESSIIS